MRFPMFSDDQIVFYPVGRGGASPQGLRGGFMPHYTTRTCPRTISASPCTGPMASVIPLVMGPFKEETVSCSRDPCQHRPVRPTPVRMSPPRDRGHPSRPDNTPDAVIFAQDLLGELFGLTPAQSVNTACGDPSSHQPSPPRRSSEEQLMGRKPGRRTAPCRNRQGHPPAHVNSSQKEAEAKLHSSSNPSTGDNKSTSKTSLDCDGQKGDMSQKREWSHTVPLPGFEPRNVSVKVKQGQVFVRAVREEKNSAGRCVRKLEMQQTVTLPETVDPQCLSCSMKPDGTMLLRAPPSNQAILRASEEVNTVENQPDYMPENNSEKTTLNTESDSQNTETQEAAAENNNSEEKRELLEMEHKDTSTESDTEKEALEEKADSSTETETEDGVEKPSSTHTHTSTERETLTTNDAASHETPDDNEQSVEFVASPDADTQTLVNTNSITLGENVPQADDTEKEDTEVEARNVDISFPIVEEPDDSVSDENEMSRKSSMMEDFVLVQKDTSNCDAMNSEELDHSENAADTEIKLADKDYEKTHSTHDETDPTRPIRRTHTPATDTEETATSHPNNLETPRNHPGPFRECLPLSGFSPEDVHISVEGRTLHITATRQAELGQASYTECVSRRVELPEYVDVYTVRCVYERDHAQLLITADPLTQQHHVPVVVE